MPSVELAVRYRLSFFRQRNRFVAPVEATIASLRNAKRRTALLDGPISLAFDSMDRRVSLEITVHRIGRVTRSGNIHSELDPGRCLSNRQVGIVDCLSHGLQPKQTASLLHLSYHTVVEHINRAMHSLRVS